MNGDERAVDEMMQGGTLLRGDPHRCGFWLAKCSNSRASERAAETRSLTNRSVPLRWKSAYDQHDMKPGDLPITLLTVLIVPLLLLGGLASARQDQDAAVIDTFIGRQARRERGEEYREARKVVGGDLGHDGVPEAVVLYHSKALAIRRSSI